MRPIGVAPQEAESRDSISAGVAPGPPNGTLFDDATLERLTVASENPMVYRLGRGPEGATCRTCRWIVCHESPARKRFYKCRLRGVTSGPGTDHRLKWPACGRYAKEAES